MHMIGSYLLSSQTGTPCSSSSQCFRLSTVSRFFHLVARKIALYTALLSPSPTSMGFSRSASTTSAHSSPTSWRSMRSPSVTSLTTSGPAAGRSAPAGSGLLACGLLSGDSSRSSLSGSILSRPPRPRQRLRRCSECLICLGSVIGTKWLDV